jgi:inorganic pyrophosphatase
MADLTTLANHLDPGKRICRAIIETPRSFRNKFHDDRGSNPFMPGGLLPEGMRFPFDFGFIPATMPVSFQSTM